MGNYDEIRVNIQSDFGKSYHYDVIAQYFKDGKIVHRKRASIPLESLRESNKTPNQLYEYFEYHLNAGIPFSVVLELYKFRRERDSAGVQKIEDEFNKLKTKVEKEIYG